MHPRVEDLPKPNPDFRRFLAAVRREPVTRVPTIELAVHPQVVGQLLDEPAPWPARDVEESTRLAAQAVRLLHRLGYDVVRTSAAIPFPIEFLEGADQSEMSDAPRGWQNQHHGRIATMADFEQYPWPRPADIDHRVVDAAEANLPDGMKLVGFCGGVYEYASYLMGLEAIMLAMFDAPDLLQGVIDRVGETLLAVFETYSQRDSVAAIWLGDDLGSKNGLLVSPKFLEARIFPWYRQFADLAHKHGKPFLLHSCGRTEAVIPTLIENVGIDAKHSFEDAIEPVEMFHEKWGDRVAVMGGVDVHLLSVGDEEKIKRRSTEILTANAPRGGYVFGSGNSIPNYVSADHYMAMIEALHAFNA